MIIALTGFMLSGKTTIGRELAAYMNSPFIDLDLYILRKTGNGSASILEHQGEQQFRVIESECLREIIQSVEGPGANLILSLGGGTLISEDNLTFVKEHCTLIWLRTSLQNTKDFISNPANAGWLESRPLLKRRTLEDLYSERLPGYMAADYVFDI